jgi:hypothetical protein
MAKSAVLIAPADVTLHRISAALNEGWPANSSYVEGEKPQAHVQVADNGAWYVTFSELTPTDDVRGDYEDNDEIPESIRKALSGKRFYLVSFNDYGFGAAVVRHVLSALGAASEDIWLDNDYGVLIPAGRILAELAADPNWDWRSSRPADQRS